MRLLVTPDRLGISLPNRLVALGHPAQEQLDLAAAAEASGVFGSVWVGDSLLAKPRLEALVLLGALAARTSHVRLGTLCLASFAFRDPTLLAIQVASLDRLSGGRLVLGVCAGPGAGGGHSARAELVQYGMRSGERFGIVQERIGALRQLLGQTSPKPGEHDGPQDTTGAVLHPVEPPPVQARLPILLAATPPEGDEKVETRMLTRVAKLADGWIADAVSADRFRSLRRRLEEVADLAGRPEVLRQSVIHVPVVVAERRVEAEATAREFIAAHMGNPVGDVSIPTAGAYGSPSLVADHVAGLVDAGAGTIVLRILDPDPQRQLDRILSGVLA